MPNARYGDLVERQLVVLRKRGDVRVWLVVRLVHNGDIALKRTRHHVAVFRDKVHGDAVLAIGFGNFHLAVGAIAVCIVALGIYVLHKRAKYARHAVVFQFDAGIPCLALETAAHHVRACHNCGLLRVGEEFIVQTELQAMPLAALRPRLAVVSTVVEVEQHIARVRLVEVAHIDAERAGEGGAHVAGQLRQIVGRGGDVGKGERGEEMHVKRLACVDSLSVNDVAAVVVLAHGDVAREQARGFNHALRVAVFEVRIAGIVGHGRRAVARSVSTYGQACRVGRFGIQVGIEQPALAAHLHFAALHRGGHGGSEKVVVGQRFVGRVVSRRHIREFQRLGRFHRQRAGDALLRRSLTERNALSGDRERQQHQQREKERGKMLHFFLLVYSFTYKLVYFLKIFIVLV